MGCMGSNLLYMCVVWCVCVGGGGPSKIQARVKEEFKARYIIIYSYIYSTLVCTKTYPHVFTYMHRFIRIWYVYH